MLIAQIGGKIANACGEQNIIGEEDQLGLTSCEHLSVPRA